MLLFVNHPVFQNFILKSTPPEEGNVQPEFYLKI